MIGVYALLKNVLLIRQLRRQGESVSKIWLDGLGHVIKLEDQYQHNGLQVGVGQENCEGD